MTESEMRQVTLFKLRKRPGEFIPDAIGVRVRKRQRVQEHKQPNASALDLSNLSLNEEKGNAIPLPLTGPGDAAEISETEYVMFRRVQQSDALAQTYDSTGKHTQLDKNGALRHVHRDSMSDNSDIPYIKLDSVAERTFPETFQGKNPRDANRAVTNDNVNEIALPENDMASHGCSGVCDECNNGSAATLVLFARDSQLGTKGENKFNYGKNDRHVLEGNLGFGKHDETVKVEQNEPIILDQVSEVKGEGLLGQEDHTGGKTSQIGRTVYLDEDDLFGDGWYIALEGESDEDDDDARKRSDLDNDDGSDLDARTVDYPSTPEEYSDGIDVLWDDDDRKSFISDGVEYERYDHFEDEYDSEC